jgi:hypothetical protein
MPRAPELPGGEHRHEDVEHQRHRADRRRRQAREREHRDVARCPCMPHRGVEERDHPDREGEDEDLGGGHGVGTGWGRFLQEETEETKAEDRARITGGWNGRAHYRPRAPGTDSFWTPASTHSIRVKNRARWPFLPTIVIVVPPG